MSEINMQQKLLSEFNNSVGVFKARLADQNDKHFLSSAQKAQLRCKDLLENIQTRFRTVKFPISERTRVQKLTKDFQQIAMEFQKQCDLFLAAKKRDFDEADRQYQNCKNKSDNTKRTLFSYDVTLFEKALNITNMRINSVGESLDDSNDDFSAVEDESQDSKQKQKQVEIAIAPELEIQHALVKEKNEELKKVQSDIKGIAVLMSDVGRIVQEQGQQIDVIAENTHIVHVNVQKANTELNDAEKLHKAATKKKCCLLLIGLAVLAAIVVPIAVIA